MKHYIKFVVTILAAAAMLAALVGAASANRISLTARALRVTWSSLEFVGPTTLRCRITLEGTVHESTIAKTENALLGYVTAARVAHPCTGGSAWAYNGSEVNEALGSAVLSSSFPWHVRYVGFEGTLPNPTAARVSLQGARWLLRASFFGIPILCTYTTSATNGLATATLSLSETRVTSIRAGNRIRSETGGCPEGSFNSPTGDGIATALGTGNAVSMTLI